MDIMRKHFWIIAGLTGLVACISVFLFFTWRQPPEKGEISREGFPSGTKSSPGFQKEIPKPVEKQISGAEWTLPEPEESESKKLGFKPILEQESDNFSGAFLEKFYSLVSSPSVSVPITPQFKVKEWTLPVSTPTQLPELESKPLKRVLTDEEWFKIAYPDYAINSYRVWENFMRQQGFLSESEKFELNSLEQIRVFAHKMIDFALQKGLINETEVAELRHANDVVLPDLQKMERRFLEGSFSQNGFGAFLSELGDLFDFSKKARATEVTTPYCYRMGASMGGGSNLVAVCCNCGWAYYGTTVVYYEDCLQNNALCLTGSGLGCLNLICSSPLPALYDSGICGCDPP